MHVSGVLGFKIDNLKFLCATGSNRCIFKGNMAGEDAKVSGRRFRVGSDWGGFTSTACLQPSCHEFNAE